MSTATAPTRPVNDDDETATTSPASPPSAPAKSRKRIILPVLGVLVLGGLVYGGKTVMYARAHESTDNAQVDGHIVPVLAKVGGYVTAVNAVENQPVKEGALLVQIDDAEYKVRVAQAEAELAAAQAELEGLAGELSERRRRAAPDLAAAVRERLAELAMPDAEFSVKVAAREDGCGPRGSDTVELLIAPNPGMPAGPLREIASGGELSRVMLAILSVAHASPGDGEPAEADPLLVFDEIDAGIGGHTARAVGEHLRDLAAGRQILCITHLPQVAAMAARHFTIAKDTTAAPARTAVWALDGDQVVGELVRMLGAAEGDRAASRHARQLLRAA